MDTYYPTLPTWADSHPDGTPNAAVIATRFAMRERASARQLTRVLAANLPDKELVQNVSVSVTPALPAQCDHTTVECTCDLCESCDYDSVVGVTGNGERYCANCLAEEYLYALKHVPEAMIGCTFLTYRAECAARMDGQLRPVSGGAR